VLRLGSLIIRVRHVKGRLGRLDVEVQRISGARVKIEPVEERRVIARVVQRLELRRIEESLGA